MHERNKIILDKALAHVKSVPYNVSLRWLFYRLYQDGIYKTKEDYNHFKGIQAMARKRCQRGWQPSTLVDDTRQIVWRGIGYKNKKEWINNLECDLDKFRSQKYFVMILFEARAMFDQFAYYTKNIPLVAFGGDPSIYLKYKIAVAIKTSKKKYKKPIVILYFGDCDKKGEEIRENAMGDISFWAQTKHIFERCGLTEKQAEKFNLPKNPEKPKSYQWEALKDNQAKEIIMEYVKKYQDGSKFKPIENKEQKISKEAKNKLGGRGK